jgi:hypothetical protein
MGFTCVRNVTASLYANGRLTMATVNKEIAQVIALNNGVYPGDPQVFAVYRYNNVFDNTASYLLAYRLSDVQGAIMGGFCPNLCKLWDRVDGLTLAGQLEFK